MDSENYEHIGDDYCMGVGNTTMITIIILFILIIFLYFFKDNITYTFNKICNCFNFRRDENFSDDDVSHTKYSKYSASKVLPGKDTPILTYLDNSNCSMKNNNKTCKGSNYFLTSIGNKIASERLKNLGLDQVLCKRILVLKKIHGDQIKDKRKKFYFHNPNLKFPSNKLMITESNENKINKIDSQKVITPIRKNNKLYLCTGSFNDYQTEHNEKSVGFVIEDKINDFNYHLKYVSRNGNEYYACVDKSSEQIGTDEIKIVCLKKKNEMGDNKPILFSTMIKLQEGMVNIKPDQFSSEEYDIYSGVTTANAVIGNSDNTEATYGTGRIMAHSETDNEDKLLVDVIAEEKSYSSSSSSSSCFDLMDELSLNNDGSILHSGDLNHKVDGIVDNEHLYHYL